MRPIVGRRRKCPRADPIRVDPHDLPRLHIALKSRPDRIKCARLAGHAPIAVGRLADRQRPNPPRVAARLHSIRKQKQQAERPLQVLQHVRHRIVLFHVRRLGQQVNDDFRVGRRLENMPVLLVLRAEQGGVYQISIMSHRHRPHQILPQQRLRVAELRRSGRRISHMPNGRMPGQFLAQHPRIEDLRNQPHRRMPVECAIGGNRNPRRLLTAMLKRKKPLITDLRRILRPPNAKQPAFFLLLVLLFQLPLPIRRERVGVRADCRRIL